MAIRNGAAQQNITGQQERQSSHISCGQSLADKKTTPILREEVAFIDTLLAKYLLVSELVQIPEFAELWAQARKSPTEIIGLIKPKLEDILADLSPEARGALLMGEKAYGLYDKKVINEAEAVAIGL